LSDAPLELGDQSETVAFLDRLARYIIDSSVRQPIVLLVDDAVSIDAASRRVLDYLARAARIEKAPFHLVLADRSADRKDVGEAEVLRLEPISTEATLAAARSRSDLAAIPDSSRPSPFAVTMRGPFVIA
jgi:hypothetical protein